MQLLGILNLISHGAELPEHRSTHPRWARDMPACHTDMSGNHPKFPPQQSLFSIPDDGNGGQEDFRPPRVGKGLQSSEPGAPRG